MLFAATFKIIVFEIRIKKEYFKYLRKILVHSGSAAAQTSWALFSEVGDQGVGANIFEYFKKYFEKYWVD